MSLIIVNKDFEPTWCNMPEEEYHADKSAVNSSSLKLLKKSPFAFKRQFIDGDNPTKTTKQMKFGSLAHMALLEASRFRDTYVVMPDFTGLTLDGRESKQSKEARSRKTEWIEEQELLGRMIVTQEERDKLFWMVDSVMANPEATRLLKDGQPEVTGYYADPVTGILCRIRPDFLAFDLSVLVDIKTVSDADLDFIRRCRVEDVKYNYPFQMAMYSEGAEVISKKKIEHRVWIFIENEFPFECVVLPMEELYFDYGKRQYRESLNNLKQCIDSDVWSRIPSMQTMFPTDYFLNKQEIP